jgi:hypothetical protein
VARGVKIRSLGTLLPSPREFARLVETWRLEPHRAWTRHDAHARTGPRHLPAVGSNLPVSGVQGPSPAARFSACRETTKRACRKPWGARTCVASRKCALRPSIRRLLIELVQDKTWRRARGGAVSCIAPPAACHVHPRSEARAHLCKLRLRAVRASPRHPQRRRQYGSADRSMMALSSGWTGSRRRSRSAFFLARYALDAAAWAALASGCLRGRPRGRRGTVTGSIISRVPGSCGSWAMPLSPVRWSMAYYI